MSASPSASASASATPETSAAAAVNPPTVEEGSATPEPQTEPSQTQDKGKGKATDEVWDPSAQTLPEGSKPAEGAAATTPAVAAPVAAVPAAAPAADPSNPWQAVWSAESNGMCRLPAPFVSSQRSLVFLERENRRSYMDEPNRDRSGCHHSRRDRPSTCSSPR
jgi:hypothetical protein